MRPSINESTRSPASAPLLPRSQELKGSEGGERVVSECPSTRCEWRSARDCMYERSIWCFKERREIPSSKSRSDVFSCLCRNVISVRIESYSGPYFSRKARISSRVEAMLFVISSAVSQNCCWLASMTSSDIVVSKFYSAQKKRCVNNFVTPDVHGK